MGFSLSSGTTEAKKKQDELRSQIEGSSYNPSSEVTSAKSNWGTKVDNYNSINANDYLGKADSAWGNYQTALGNYQNMSFEESDKSKNAYNNYLQDRASKPGDYSEAQSVVDARNYLDKINSARPESFQYDDTALQNVYDKIMNREDFSFDLNSSALYQQYKDQYVALGQQAMADTMGQASAMTGGYGSSYAVSAGQQAYQQQLQNLSDIVPQLYNQALQTYQMEGDQLLNQYNVAASERSNAYGVYRDNVADWQNDRSFAYGQYSDERSFDYGKWQDSYNNWLNTTNLDLSAYNTFYGQDMDLYNSNLNQAANVAGMLQDDYNNLWNQGFNLYSSDLDKAANNANWAWNYYTDTADRDYTTHRDGMGDLKYLADSYGTDYWNGYTNDYGQYRDTVEDEHWQKEYDYGLDRAKAEDKHWQKEYEYGQTRDDKEDAKWALEYLQNKTNDDRNYDLKVDQNGNGSTLTKEEDTALEAIDAAPDLVSADGKHIGYSALSKEAKDLINPYYMTMNQTPDDAWAAKVLKAVNKGTITPSEAKWMLTYYGVLKKR